MRHILCMINSLLLIIGLIGCDNDFLETSPKDMLTEDMVFSDIELTRSNLLSIYERMPRVFSSSDDVNTKDMTSPGSSSFKKNDFSAADGPLSGRWYVYYAAIRTANSFIESLLNSPLPEADKQIFRAEARCLRATLYLELYRLFRGCPLIKKNQPINDEEAFLVPRATDVETFGFIVDELKSVAEILPLKWKGRDLGRFTKGGAEGLLSRILLYQASLTNDKNLFKEAAAAAKSVIDSRVYSLCPDYGKMFLMLENSEYMVYYSYIGTSQWRGWDYYGGWNLSHIPQSEGGWCANYPTQNLVDAFYMKDGKAYTESPLYDPQNPYVNRDPRFYECIYYQGSTFKGRPLEFWKDENMSEGKDYVISNNIGTGYFIKKGIDESIPDYFNNLGAPDNMSDPYLRYADVLLMYAEAENEAAGPVAGVYDAINQVRQRAKMPVLPSGLSQQEMREKIRNERRVELCFEQSRYHDVRRWGIANEECAGPVYRANITKKADGTFIYDREVLETRSFSEKYVLNPIPQDEIYKNAKLKQNPGF